MKYTLVTRRVFIDPDEVKEDTVSSWSEAVHVGRDIEAKGWVVILTVTNNGSRFTYKAWGESVTPEAMGVAIRMDGAGRKNCPSVEAVVDMVNDLWGSQVLSREVLRNRECLAARELQAQANA